MVTEQESWVLAGELRESLPDHEEPIGLDRDWHIALVQIKEHGNSGRPAFARRNANRRPVRMHRAQKCVNALCKLLGTEVSLTENRTSGYRLGHGECEKHHRSKSYDRCGAN